MPPCTPERDRQLLSLMWNTANLNRFSAGPLRDAMLMKEDTVGSPPPSLQGLADCRADRKVERKHAPLFCSSGGGKGNVRLQKTISARLFFNFCMKYYLCFIFFFSCFFFF